MARTPRGEVVDSDEVGCVHIVQRCVRKSFLFGVDQATGKNYEHRKTLIQERLQFLARYFAVDVLAFAVLSNHTHGVLRNRPDLVKEWSDEQVARRWLHIFPMRKKKADDEVPEPNEVEIQMLTGDSAKMKELRSRLSSISWFMRCLAEVIARAANKEDERSGPHSGAIGPSQRWLGQNGDRIRETLPRQRRQTQKSERFGHPTKPPTSPLHRQHRSSVRQSVRTAGTFIRAEMAWVLYIGCPVVVRTNQSTENERNSNND